MKLFGTSELAELYALPVWTMRKQLDLLEASGVEVQRVGGGRVIRQDQLPALEARLRRSGLLAREAEAAATA